MEPDRLDATPPAGVVPVDLRDWARFSRDAAVRVRVVATPSLGVDLWCVEPQQATPVLHAPADVVYTVLGGRSWFVTEAGEVGLDPLGSLVVPAGTVHGIDNRAPDPLVVLAVCSPPGTAPPDAPVVQEGRAVRLEHRPGGPLRALAARFGRR